jgi:FkbM family methyltransferase
MHIENRPDAELDALLSEDPAAVLERERGTFDRLVSPFEGSYILFGAGGLGRRTAAGLRRLGIEPLAFSDNNKDLWGHKIDGLAVLAPDEAVKKFGLKAAFIVSIWSDTIGHPVDDIQRQLSGYGPARVISFAFLYWKYPSTFLPYFSLDLPHKTMDQAAEIRAAWRLWSDLYSKQEFLAQLRWRTQFDFSQCHHPIVGEQYFPRDLFPLLKNEVFVDGGAFDGDTIRQFLRHTRMDFGGVIAFEPDRANFEKLTQYVLSLDDHVGERIALYPLALGSQKGRVCFDAAGTIQSAIKAEGGSMIEVAALDDMLEGSEPTYIKLDIEGYEPEALAGARKTLSERCPVVGVSAYHHFDHLWKIPLFLSSLTDQYSYHLRPYARPPWELICYAVPENRLAKNRV